MKIFESQRNQGIEKVPESSGSHVPGRSGAFQELLSSEVENSSTSVNQAGSGENLSGLERLNAMSCLSPISISPASDLGETLGAVAKNLDRLARELEDPCAIHPKRAEALLRSLSTEADRLGEETRSLPEGHPLRRISDELRIMTYVESVKWNRGDYL